MAVDRPSPAVLPPRVRSAANCRGWRLPALRPSGTPVDDPRQVNRVGANESGPVLIL